MSKLLKMIPYPKSIKTNNGLFSLAMITKKHVYYINWKEDDESSATIIFDLNMKKLSDNIHATNSLMDDINHKRFVWLSSPMKYNVKNILAEE